MNVSELIALLQAMPPDAAVIVRGYEDGVNKADRVRECRIKPFRIGIPADKFNKLYKGDDGDLAWYYGRNKISGDGGDKAVYISSSRDGYRNYSQLHIKYLTGTKWHDIVQV